jgi:hypothetical protein
VHQGFPALRGLVAALQPALLLHGHVLPYDAATPDHDMGATTVRNVTGWHLIDIQPHSGATQPGAAHPGPYGRRVAFRPIEQSRRVSFRPIKQGMSRAC